MMVRRQMVRGLAVLALAVAAVQVVPGGTPAGACSFVGSVLSVPDSVAAGGTLVFSGSGFFDIEGEVGADCGGDYEFVPRTGVVITVTFETASGPKVVELDAPVTAGDEGDEQRFTVGPFEVDVPADALSATVDPGGFDGYTVAVTGGPTTTTSTPTTSTPTSVPAPAPAPTPADPVDATPAYTG